MRQCERGLTICKWKPVKYRQADSAFGESVGKVGKAQFKFSHLAELLRWSLRLILPTDQSRPWMRHAGMIESGEARSSQRIDDLVYGQKA